MKLIYALVSTLTCFVILQLSPNDKLPSRDYVVASLIISVVFGWLIWLLVLISWVLSDDKKHWRTLFR